MSVTFASSAIVNSSTSFQYRGEGYRYFLHSKGPQGTRASIQVKSSLMNLFIQRVGAINSSRLPQLVFSESGRGWFTATVLDERDAHVVSKFLARFNKWMFRQAKEASASKVQGREDHALVVKYRVVAPEYSHAPKAAAPRAPQPSAGALLMLASMFNRDHHRQFGHR